MEDACEREYKGCRVYFLKKNYFSKNVGNDKGFNPR
jgi:hypothetical protein